MERGGSMKLLKVEAHGFKSFADKVSISFDQGVTGVVGPNGCGKSNITDAIKWVLGEQSAKSLRGGKMIDIIFAGSQDRRAVNMAEVTLVFENKDRAMSIDADTVEITRRLYRDESLNEYFINKTQSRLKDIQNIIMDTGLGKGSLAMISQGTISQFAEAKPQDRRVIFEEAAGVAKYKKRKIESLRKLERTQENLDRVEDIVNELEKQVIPLRKQSSKAKVFLEKKDELEKIEVALLVKDIETYQKQLEDIEKTLHELGTSKTENDSVLSVKETKVKEIRDKVTVLDNEINDLQAELMFTINQAQRFESQKMEIDSKRENALLVNSNDKSNKVIALKAQVNDLSFEVADRENRLKEAREEMNYLVNDRDVVKSDIIGSRDELENAIKSLNTLTNKRDFLNELLKNKSNLHAGVKAVLNNASALTGIVGMLQENISYDEKYALAISTAMGSAGQNIVVKTQSNAKDAVNFLKKNNAGRATFLPLDGLNERIIREEAKVAVDTIKGYLGVMSDFISTNNSKEAVNFIFGNVLVAQDLDAANAVSNITYKRYKVVTLDGQVINAGGSITGGNISKIRTAKDTKDELNDIENKLIIRESDLRELRIKLDRLETKQYEVANSISAKEVQIARLEEVFAEKKSRLNISVTELEELTGEKVEIDAAVNGTELLTQLNETIRRRDEIRELISEKRTLKLTLSNELEHYDKNLSEARKSLRSVESTISDSKVAKSGLDVKLDYAITRLNSIYKMTFEYAKENDNGLTMDETEARELVQGLRDEIAALGNVNVDSIEQFEEINGRYESLKSQHQELADARRTLLKIIDDMDKKMTEQFSKTFDEINGALKGTFRRLFGGGKAGLEYSDPDNILESGIEVKVQPPGKAVANLNLFSGGEKSLIALSVLFAILTVRPVPLCILDEVEAPLDQANVERFATYLHEFIGKTQFIVITHRPGTMEKCDVLYGVTMQEKGVTNMVSVKLQDAVELAEE